MSQAGATSVSTYISLADTIPVDTIDLWFRIESLYNEDKAEARRPTYEFHYDYRRARIAVPVGAFPVLMLTSKATRQSFFLTILMTS